MSTNANVRIFDGDDVIACIYKHCDGYPGGLGAAIQDFSNRGSITNGFVRGENDHDFNGIECYAAGLIAYLKTNLGTSEVQIGEVYLFRANHFPGDSGEEYCYDISLQDNRLYAKVYKIHSGGRGKLSLIMSGYINELKMEEAA